MVAPRPAGREAQSSEDYISQGAPWLRLNRYSKGSIVVSQRGPRGRPGLGQLGKSVTQQMLSVLCPVLGDPGIPERDALALVGPQ